MMKKVAGFLAAAVLVFSGASPAFAGNATLSLAPASGTFNPGCSFTLTVNVDTGGAQTDGTDAIIFYDPTRFNALKINNGTAYADYSGSNIDAQNGKVTISGLATGTPFSGSGVLATIDFQVLDNAPAGATQMKFDFDPNDKAKTTDSNVVEHATVVDDLNQVVDGTYTIGTGTGCTAAAAQGTVGTTVSTPSAVIPVKTIDQLTGGGKVPGSSDGTVFIAVAGAILTILGIAGLAIL